MIETSETTALQVANFFLREAEKSQAELTLLKLIKLVYLGYGWSTAILKRPIFAETIEAWPYGPVVPNVYHAFKHYGRSPILGYDRDLDIQDQATEAEGTYAVEYGIVRKRPPVFPEDADVCTVLDWVWRRYAPYTAASLSRMTHREGSPWSQAMERSGGGCIPHEVIHDYYLGKYQELQNRQKQNEAQP